MHRSSYDGNIRPIRRTHDRTGPQILLVDDDSDILVSVGGFIESAGLNVMRVSNGMQALDLVVAGTPIDAVVSDVMMPGMSGIEFLIAARRRRLKLPALFITGYIDFLGSELLPSDVEILRKPFRRREFIARVQALIENG